MRSAGGVRWGGVAIKQGRIGNKGGVKLVGSVVGTARETKELFNFTKTTLSHMNNPNRSLPVSILENTIKNVKGLRDPMGTKALMHYTQITRDGKAYNLEVLYCKETNTILHFEYARKAMGPLKEISK